MPEHQASSSQPPPAQSPNAKSSSSRDETAPPPPETAKRTYLSLLPPPQLIDLILAFDANRQTLIFPHDLDSAIKALQRPHRPPSPSPTKDPAPAMTVVVKAEPVSSSLPPAPPKQSEASPAQPPVQPPQYTPPLPYYPYTHTPYYPPPVQHPQPSPHVSPPAPPARNPLFTSTPLNRDPNKPPSAHPPPPPLVSSRDDPNAMPSYEEMIVAAIMDVGESDGTAPKVLFAWMASHYPLQQNFRPSASQALHKALKRGRLEKLGGKYRLNPSWGGGPTTSKRATRRPTANRGLSPHTNSHPRPPPPPLHSGPVPYAHAHPPPNAQYGFPPYMHHHPSLPHGQMPVPPPWNAPPAVEEDDGVESEDMEAQEDGEVHMDEGETQMEQSVPKKACVDGGKKEEIQRSLLRLVKVLRRVARKGGAG